MLIVKAFVCVDVTGQVEYWLIQQSLMYQIEYIQYSAGSAISIIERVYALELVMQDSHFDQRIDIPGGIVIEYREKIEHLLRLKFREVKSREPLQARAALLRFAAGRGFEADLSVSAVNRVTDEHYIDE